MDFLRKHWFDLGGFFGLVILGIVFFISPQQSAYQSLMWLSLSALFFHQVEEYRMPGTFPGMINRVMFHSKWPDRYPLNSNTALIINVALGWTVYLLAAITGEQFVWLGMACILVSLGNIIAHTFIFNLKGRTIYNAGLVTSWLCLAPCVFFYFKIVSEEVSSSVTDYLIGIPLGIVINFFGVFKPIIWLADHNTIFDFKNRHLLPDDRKKVNL